MFYFILKISQFVLSLFKNTQNSFLVIQIYFTNLFVFCALIPLDLRMFGMCVNFSKFS